MSQAVYLNEYEPWLKASKAWQVLGYHILEVDLVGKEALRKTEQARHVEMRELQTKVRLTCQKILPFPSFSEVPISFECTMPNSVSINVRLELDGHHDRM